MKEQKVFYGNLKYKNQYMIQIRIIYNKTKEVMNKENHGRLETRKFNLFHQFFKKTHLLGFPSINRVRSKTIVKD